MSWTWGDARALGEALYERFPDTEPLSVRFVDLHRWVTELDGFADDPESSTERHLEAIQMVWFEEWKLDHE